jgi:oligoribonuclease
MIWPRILHRSPSHRLRFQQFKLRQNYNMVLSKEPLVWIDCEMSGLKRSDVLLQIACYVTTHDLELVEPNGIDIVINHPQSVLDGMDEWCTKTHGETGLSARVLESKTTVEEAGQQLLDYIKKHVPVKGSGLLAGNTVHMDKRFLEIEMPEVIDYLHYRIYDNSAIKEAAKRWCSEDIVKGLPPKLMTHEARQDILESIAEAKYWKDVLFAPAKPIVSSSE